LNTCEILKNYKNIAVVGYKPSRISGEIAHILANSGYKVVGVNPKYSEEAPIPVYKSLLEIPFHVEILDVFRNSDSIPELIPDVLAIHPEVLWLQLGIRNDIAVQPAIENGIIVIQDTCIKIEYFSCF